MLQEANGDWGTVELKVKKTFEKQEETKLWGKYVTAIWLESQGWTPDMIENSKAWAKTQGYHRTSEIHGQEEWKLPLDEEFSNLERRGEKIEATTSTAVQDTGLCVIIFTYQIINQSAVIHSPLNRLRYRMEFQPCCRATLRWVTQVVRGGLGS